jgi:ubiquinone/menaquinone biosynthesis C-methylase UbiE
MKYMKKEEKYWNNVYQKFHRSKPKRLSVWNESSNPFIERLMLFLKQQGVNKVIDAGCGDGRNIKSLLAAGFSVVGVDISKVALANCRKNFKNKKLKLLYEPLESKKFEDSSFDAIICDHVLVHIKDVNNVIANFYRILKKGGYALIEFTSPQDSTFGQGQRLSRNEFSQNGVYLRYDTIKDIYRFLNKFDILCFTSEYYTDPPHGAGYIRKKRHGHHSYFVLARK